MAYSPYLKTSAYLKIHLLQIEPTEVPALPVNTLNSACRDTLRLSCPQAAQIIRGVQVGEPPEDAPRVGIGDAGGGSRVGQTIAFRGLLE